MEKFIVTGETGRLARWLRLLGYDTVLHDSTNRPALIIQALRQGRTILTRIGTVPSHRGARLLRIESDKIKEQIAQVTKAFKIKPDKNKMFTRCILCNEVLTTVEKSKVKNKVPPYVFETQEDFVCCPCCQKIYWQGTHWGNALKYLQEIAY